MQLLILLLALSMTNQTINPNLLQNIKTFEGQSNTISKERQTQLLEISDYISEKISKDQEINITFICTHNSRRSHLAQLWAMAASEYYEIENVKTYSGGTEATAFNPRAVKAIKEDGFLVSELDQNKNKRYKVSLSDGGNHSECWSKKFTDEANPQSGFAAVMVCSDADEACPYVAGAEARFSLPYDDPKAFDGTDQEEEKYLERSHQIATEILFVFKNVKK